MSEATTTYKRRWQVYGDEITLSVDQLGSNFYWDVSGADWERGLNGVSGSYDVAVFCGTAAAMHFMSQRVDQWRAAINSAERDLTKREKR